MGKAGDFQAQDRFRYWAMFETSHRMAYLSTFIGSDTRMTTAASAQ